MTTQITIPLALLEQLVGALEQIQALTDGRDIYLGSPPTESKERKILNLATESLTAGRAAIDGAERVGWQPIYTAPKDFVTMFDGWDGERVVNVTWSHPEYSSKGHYAWCVSEYEPHQGWVNIEVKGLTHWIPIPAAPQGGTK